MPIMDPKPTFRYRPPIRSKKQQVLDKHGYEEKVFHNTETNTMTRFLVPIYDSPADRIANINEGVDGPDRFTGSIVFRDGERVRDLFLRLGWIDEAGHIL